MVRAAACSSRTESSARPWSRSRGRRCSTLARRDSFSALVTDKTPGARQFRWLDGESCPSDLAEVERSARADAPGQTANTLIGPDREANSYCVWVIVTDADGEKGFASRSIRVLKRKLLVEAPAEVASGQPVRFVALYEGEPASITERSSFSWAGRAACEEAEQDALAGRAERGLFSYQYPARRGPFCVAVVARDEFEVEHRARLQIRMSQILVAPPPASIQVMSPARFSGPVGLFTEVRLAAADPGAFEPGEALRFEWKLTPPDGVVVAPPPCPDARPVGSEVCFTPEKRGNHRIEVKVSDGTRETIASPFDLQVEDRPPCIRETEPLFSSAPKFFEFYDRARVFRVLSVNDDGDPWPAPGRGSQRAFRWSIRKAGSELSRFERRVSAIFQDFTVAAREYQPGDQIEVRVEYWDRLDLENPDARDFRTRCNPDDPVCELVPGSGCYQWITWSVEYL